jgi:hypothetical protein
VIKKPERWGIVTAWIRKGQCLFLPSSVYQNSPEDSVSGCQEGQSCQKALVKRPGENRGVIVFRMFRVTQVIYELVILAEQTRTLGFQSCLEAFLMMLRSITDACRQAGQGQGKVP